MKSPCYLWIPPPPTNFWLPELIFIKFGLYIMAPEPISAAYFINPSHRSVYLYVSLLSLQGNGSANTFLRQRIIVTIEELLDAYVCGSVYPPIIAR
jgi:hypothetical protein